METPLVSVIVPIYNAAIDLVSCLESIKRQRYTNLEILLVNDGS
ncbi:MAG: glycosyltransferase, partial [Clostridiales bacterium]|nr:glycosyltransferase [Clostridiales bacterium]